MPCLIEACWHLSASIRRTRGEGRYEGDDKSGKCGSLWLWGGRGGGEEGWQKVRHGEPKRGMAKDARGHLTFGGTGVPERRPQQLKAVRKHICFVFACVYAGR